MRLLKRLLLAAFAVALLFVAAIVILYLTIPEHKGNLSHFDTIIVLGTPANLDGTPSPEQRARTMEGVREFKAGVAPHIIMTGGAAHNRFTEAHVMAELASRNGVPAEDVIEEDHAQNTVQNAYYSVQIMQAHGWRSAEVVSSGSHLPRASLIFRHFPIDWRMHAASWPPNYAWSRVGELYLGEAIYSSRLRLFGFKPSRFLPTE